MIPVRKVPHTTQSGQKEREKQEGSHRGANIIHFVDVQRARKGLAECMKRSASPTHNSTSVTSCHIILLLFFIALITSCFTFSFFVPLPPPLECKLLERKEGFLSLQNYIFTWSAGILFVRGGEYDPAQILRTHVGLGGHLQWGETHICMATSRGIGQISKFFFKKAMIILLLGKGDTNIEREKA